jgi:gamma-butyrobetaine dioxygenase
MNSTRSPLPAVTWDAETLHLQWPDGLTGVYPTVWLRDNDPADRDAHTGQRLTDIADQPEEPRLAAVESQEDGRLLLWWADEEKVSRFDPTWLRGFAAMSSDAETYRPRPILWNASDASKLVWADFAEVLHSPESRRRWLTAFAEYGLAFLRGVPTEEGQVLKVAALIGYVRETNYGRLFDVRSVPNASHLAYTDIGLALHTDNPYRDPVPGLQLLHCLQASPNGGESLFADGFALAEQLRADDPDAFALLTRTPVRFRYRDADNTLEMERPYIEVNRRGEVTAVVYNNRAVEPFRLPAETLPAFYRAYRKWARLMRDPRFVIQVPLQNGDLVAFDNTRALHGRTAFSSAVETGPPRHLQGCYVDPDGLYSALATLKRSQEVARA